MSFNLTSSKITNNLTQEGAPQGQYNQSTQTGQTGPSLSGPSLSFDGTRGDVELGNRLNSIVRSYPMDISTVEDGGRFQGIAYVKKVIVRASNRSATEEDLEFILIDTSGNQFQTIHYNPANKQALLETQGKTVRVEGTAKEFKDKLYYRLNNIVLFDEQFPLSYFLKEIAISTLTQKRYEIEKALDQMGTYKLILDSIGLKEYLDYLGTIPMKGSIGNVTKAIANALKIVDLIGNEEQEASQIQKTNETIKFLIITKYIRDFKYGEFTERRVLPIELYKSIMESDLKEDNKVNLVESLSLSKTKDNEIVRDIWNIAVKLA